MRLRPFPALLLLLPNALLSCGAAHSETEPPSPAQCGAQAKLAETRVLKVASDNQACKRDDECSVLMTTASCFSGCYQAVNETGRGAVDRAGTLVEAGECRKFGADGCSFEAPSCGPMPTTHCVNERCALADAAAAP